MICGQVMKNRCKNCVGLNGNCYVNNKCLISNRETLQQGCSMMDSNNNQCLNVKTGYAILNGSSVRCNDSCATCSQNNSNECLSCRNGYEYDASTKSCRLNCSMYGINCPGGQTCVRTRDRMYCNSTMISLWALLVLFIMMMSLD